MFVLIVQDGCSACHRFETMTWEYLREKIAEDGRFSIIKIANVVDPSTLNRRDQNGKPMWPLFKAESDSPYNKDILNYVRFFPSLFIIPTKEWMDTSKPLILTNANVYGAGPDFKPIQNGNSMTLDPIWDWIQSFKSTPDVVPITSSTILYQTPSIYLRTPEYLLEH